MAAMTDLVAAKRRYFPHVKIHSAKKARIARRSVERTVYWPTGWYQNRCE